MNGPVNRFNDLYVGRNVEELLFLVEKAKKYLSDDQ